MYSHPTTSLTVLVPVIWSSANRPALAFLFVEQEIRSRNQQDFVYSLVYVCGSEEFLLANACVYPCPWADQYSQSTLLNSCSTLSSHANRNCPRKLNNYKRRKYLWIKIQCSAIVIQFDLPSAFSFGILNPFQWPQDCTFHFLCLWSNDVLWMTWCCSHTLIAFIGQGSSWGWQGLSVILFLNQKWHKSFQAPVQDIIWTIEGENIKNSPSFASQGRKMGWISPAESVRTSDWSHWIPGTSRPFQLQTKGCQLWQQWTLVSSPTGGSGV